MGDFWNKNILNWFDYSDSCTTRSTLKSLNCIHDIGDRILCYVVYISINMSLKFIYIYIQRDKRNLKVTDTEDGQRTANIWLTGISE